MITNREVILTVKHSIADLGPISEESSFSNRELYFLLIRYRAAIIAQKMRDRGFTLNKSNYQTIGCIELESVSAADCPCIPEFNREFRRTKYPVPKVIGDYTSVISPENHISYDFIQWDAIQDLRNSRFKAEREKPYYTIKTGKDGTYIYLYNDIHGAAVAITGIFENPLEIQNFPDCDGKTDPCFAPLDEEFIIDPELLPVIYDMLLMSKFKYRPQTTDSLNNDRDDTIPDTPVTK